MTQPKVLNSEEETEAVVAFLQHCFDELNRGEEDRLIPDPFFVRPNGKPPFTDEEIDGIIEQLDIYYSGELSARRSTYEAQEGETLLPTDFGRMQSPNARRALVEGVTSIMVSHSDWTGGVSS